MAEIQAFDVEGFRSLVDVKDIPLGRPAMFTGHNDAGKSAAIHALGFFLGTGSIEADDYSRHEGDHHIHSRDEGQAGFTEDQTANAARTSTIVVTATVVLSDREQQALSLPAHVRLRRLAQPDSSPRYEIEGEYPSDPLLRDFETLGLQALKDRCAALGLAPTGVARAKASYLKPLHDRAASSPTERLWALCPTEVIDTLPRFVFFASTQEPDPAAEIRTVLAAVFKTQRLEPNVRSQIARIERSMNEKLTKEIEQLKSHLLATVPDLTGVAISPSVALTETLKDVEIRASRDEGPPVSLGSSGAGRRRLLALAVWEWSSRLLELSDENDVGVVIAYDEPDTHLDYGRQRRLMELFHSQCARRGVQMVVATHSLNLVDRVQIQEIAHFKLAGARTVVDRLITDDDKSINDYLVDVSSAMGLRNSVLLHERCFVVVEGATEQQTFPTMFRLVNGLPFQSVGIVLIAADGNEGALKVAGHLKSLGRTVHLVLDSDTRSNESTKRMFRPERLRWLGFDPDLDVTYVGSAELEDLFSDSDWVTAANNRWPRVDGRPWQESDFAAHRDGAKFSSLVLEMIDTKSTVGARYKHHLVRALVDQVGDAVSLPPKLVDAMKTLDEIARRA